MFLQQASYTPSFGGLGLKPPVPIRDAFSRLVIWATRGYATDSSRWQDHLDYFQRVQDPKDNTSTSPPPGESIDVHCIWVGELYLATHIQELKSSLDKLGWLQADRDERTDNNLEQWLDGATLRLSGAAWRNIGVVTRIGETRFFLSNFHAPLPDIVDYARASIHYISPGLIGVVLQFVLKESGAKLLEYDLCQPRSTYIVPHGNRLSFISPVAQKMESSSEVRRVMRTECSSWIRHHLPGFFSPSANQPSTPTAEFITLQKNTPFADSQRGWPDYLHVLQLGRSLDVWESSEVPGIKLSYVRQDTGTPLALVLAARENDLEDKNLDSYGGRDRHGYTNWLSHFDSTFVIWVLYAMMGALEAEYAKFRNILASVDLGKPDRAARQLQDCQRNFLELSRSVIPVANVLKDRLKENRWFRGDEYVFLPTNKARQQDPPLFESIREGLAIRAGELLTLEGELDRIAGNQTTLVSTISADRTNKSLVRLSVVLVALTVAIVALTAVFVWRS